MWYKAGICACTSVQEKSDESEVKAIMHKCTLCNEHIEDVDFQFGDAVEVDEECWHVECYAEYFDVALETV